MEVSAMLPETKYAKSGDVHIAYQVIGSGRIDLVFLSMGLSHRGVVGRAIRSEILSTIGVVLTSHSL
jgi:hypothetical protein